MGLPRGRRTPCHQYQLREIRQTLLPISKRAFRKITSSNRSSPLNPDAPCFKPSTSLNPNVSNNPLNNSQIKILSTNARSLLPNMTKLQMITNALQPDIIAVTETWLSKSVPDNLLALPNGGYSQNGPNLGGFLCREGPAGQLLRSAGAAGWSAASSQALLSGFSRPLAGKKASY